MLTKKYPMSTMKISMEIHPWLRMFKPWSKYGYVVTLWWLSAASCCLLCLIHYSLTLLCIHSEIYSLLSLTWSTRVTVIHVHYFSVASSNKWRQRISWLLVSSVVTLMATAIENKTTSNATSSAHGLQVSAVSLSSWSSGVWNSGFGSAFLRWSSTLEEFPTRLYLLLACVCIPQCGLCWLHLGWAWPASHRLRIRPRELLIKEFKQTDLKRGHHMLAITELCGIWYSPSCTCIICILCYLVCVASQYHDVTCCMCSSDGIVSKPNFYQYQLGKYRLILILIGNLQCLLYVGSRGQFPCNLQSKHSLAAMHLRSFRECSLKYGHRTKILCFWLLPFTGKCSW